MIPVPTRRSDSQIFRTHLLAMLLFGTSLLGGCAVIAVADVAASAVVGVAGLAVDAAVGTARIGGKIIGAGADAVLGSEDEATDD